MKYSLSSSGLFLQYHNFMEFTGRYIRESKERQVDVWHDGVRTSHDSSGRGVRAGARRHHRRALRRRQTSV